MGKKSDAEATDQSNDTTQTPDGLPQLARRSYVDVEFLKQASLEVAMEYDSQFFIGPEDDPRGPSFSGFAPVWHALDAVLYQRNNQPRYITWADIEAPGVLHVSHLLRVADKALSDCLNQASASASALLAGYRTFEAATVDPLRALEWRAVQQIHARLSNWQALRELTLNEACHEAWMELLRVARRHHEQLLQLQALAESLRREHRTLRLGDPLVDAVVDIAQDLLRIGRLPASLAEDIAQTTHDQREALAVFEREGRQQELVWCKDFLGAPERYQGLAFRYAESVPPRRLLWPVKETERKKSGDLAYKIGVHFKRHTETAAAEKLADSFRDVASCLQILEPDWSKLPTPIDQGWDSLVDNISSLRNALGNVQDFLRALYGNVNRSIDSSSHPDEFDFGDPGDGEPPDNLDGPSEEEWLARPEVQRYRMSDIFRTRFAESLHRLDFSKFASAERQLFCVVCHRTKSSKHYCFRHEEDGAVARQEIRQSAGKGAIVDKVLHANRTQRLSQWAQRLLKPIEARSRNGWQNLPLGEAPYLTLRLGVGALSDLGVGDAVPSALQALDALEDLAHQGMAGESSRFDSMIDGLNQIRGIIDPQSAPTAPNAGERWLTTVRAIRQAAQLKLSIEELADFITLSESVRQNFGITADPGPGELRDALLRFIEQLVVILCDDVGNEAGYSPQLPDQLNRHFLLLWFQGGAWWSRHAGRVLRFEEHDGGPRATARLTDTVALAQQIERWSAWRAIDSIPTRERTSRYNSVESILALKQQGMSGPRIAAELGITYEAVKMALMRHARRQAQEAKSS